MKLTIDTTNSKEIRVNLQKGEERIEEISVSQNGRAESILNLVDRVLKKNNLDVRDIKEIQFKKGPGSYTGLKAGVAVANALSFALNIPINNLPVESFEVPVYD